MTHTIITYNDIDFDFISHPQSGDLVKISGVKAIIQSMTNLILTKFYEKPMHPEIGSNLYGLLFEPATSNIAGLIRDTIQEVLVNYENRVEIVFIDVEASTDESGYNVTLEFRLINDTEIQVVELFLTRIR